MLLGQAACVAQAAQAAARGTAFGLHAAAAHVNCFELPGAEEVALPSQQLPALQECLGCAEVPPAPLHTNKTVQQSCQESRLQEDEEPADMMML